ncbi:protein-glutamine gamma-glutamyltransferase [Paenibacillus sp. NPDC056579]|uniref:protein-glutamine gamma-glutamyltransferase n=1 Tax=Paenibacillus sp. NPDC056579 TaxID=3345871 RepID=UPI00367B025A
MIRIPNLSAPPDNANLSDIQKAIYNEKVVSPATYEYDSWDALAFELKMREAIIRAASDLNSGQASFASFKKSRSNEAYWERQENGAFLLRKGVSPSAAVRDIFLNGSAYAFECATAIIIVLYKAVLDVIGDEKFDKLFADLYLYSWNYDRDLKLITDHTGAESFGGDILYFKNPEVNPEWIEWQGENAVKMGPDLYYGHGVGIESGTYIIEKLNKLRVPGATKSAYLMDDVTHPDFAYLHKIATSADPLAVVASSRIKAKAGQVVAKIGSLTGIYNWYA